MEGERHHQATNTAAGNDDRIRYRFVNNVVAWIHLILLRPQLDGTIDDAKPTIDY